MEPTDQPVHPLRDVASYLGITPEVLRKIASIFGAVKNDRREYFFTRDQVIRLEKLYQTFKKHDTI